MAYYELNDFTIESGNDPGELFVDAPDFCTIRIVYNQGREISVEILPQDISSEPADVAQATAEDLGRERWNKDLQ